MVDIVDNINKKMVYLLEGLPGLKLVKETFKREKIDENLDDSTAERIAKKKKEIFKQIQNSKPLTGARELINDLKSCRCMKAVVSGCSKEEIETVLDENIGSNNFDFVISSDELHSSICNLTFRIFIICISHLEHLEYYGIRLLRPSGTCTYCRFYL